MPRPAHVRKRTDGMSSPAPPTDARRGTVHPPRRAGHASPAARTHKGEGWRVHPLRTGYASPAFTHAAMPALARGCKRVGAPSPAPSVRGVLPSPPGLHAAPEKRCVQGGGPHARTHAREGGTRDEGRCNPSTSGERSRTKGVQGGGAERNPGGGAAHERKGRHIGARVRKGESDGEGVVNEAKRSRGEAARANSGHPPHQ
ncbi:hypothetical protein EDB85DRAFT_2158095 [Lactarius pseudohatsudake]|nr:hypothetical protein EDB85DRAFT_2158095 [Lactarius pseudohatsudake]